ncbi:hypothetical protein E3N88_05321 [Mikania micrantha]|uniref:Uncharacterized protein n=1 Tax=Mikania micrantha TaxID=192012 RepID=A0A5N6PMK1_9ASTR|nr:hypothetical protein E3N88_05321 [Mikania micrantha]
MHTRSTKASKKRKGTDPINMDDIPDFPAADLLQKIAGDKEAFKKQIEDLEDQKKIAVAKAGQNFAAGHKVSAGSSTVLISGENFAARHKVSAGSSSSSDFRIADASQMLGLAAR